MHGDIHHQQSIGCHGVIEIETFGSAGQAHSNKGNVTHSTEQRAHQHGMDGGVGMSMDMCSSIGGRASRTFSFPGTPSVLHRQDDTWMAQSV